MPPRYDSPTSQGDEILLRTANVDATRPGILLPPQMLADDDDDDVNGDICFVSRALPGQTSLIPSFVLLGLKSATYLIVSMQVYR